MWWPTSDVSPVLFELSVFLALFLALPLAPSFPALPHLDLEPLPEVADCLGLLLSGLGRG